MSFFQKLKKRKLLLFFAAFFIGPIYLSFHFLPQIAEKIIGIYLNEQGFEDVHLKIDTITAHELSIRSFQLGKEKELTISKAKFLYSFNEILEGKIDSIEITGLSVNLHLNKGKVSSGILKSSQQGESPTKRSLPPVLPFNKLIINSSFINILTPDEKITASLSGNIDSSKGLNFMKSNFDVTLRDQSRNLTAKAFIEGSPTNFRGNFDLTAKGGINLPETADVPQATINIKSNISFHDNLLDLEVSKGAIRFEKPVNVKKHNAIIEPFLLSLKKETKAEFQIDLSDINNPGVSYDLQLEPTLIEINIHDKNIENIPISFNVREARIKGSPSNFKGSFDLTAKGGINLPETVDVPQATINIKSNISFHNNLLDLEVSKGAIRFEKPVNVKKHNAIIEPFLLSLKKETKAEFQIDLTDIKNPGVSYDLQLEPTLIEVNVHDKNLKNIPIRFDLQEAKFNGNLNSLNYKVKSFIEEDLFIKADEIIVSLNGSIDNPTKTPLIKSDVQINLRNKDGILNAKAFIEGSPSNFKGNIHLSAEGGFKYAEIVRIPAGTLNLKSNISYRDGLLDFHLKDASLRTDKAVEAGKFNARIGPFQLALNKGNTAIISIDLNRSRLMVSDVTFAPSKINATVKDKKKGISLHFDFQKASLAGELSFAKGKPLDYKIYTALKESSLNVPEFDVTIKEIDLKAEISSLNAANKIKLSFSNVQLEHDRETPYSVPLFMRGELNLTNGLSEFNGQINNFNNDLVLDFSGAHETENSKGKARFKLHPLLFSKDSFQPSGLFPIAGDIISNVEGEIEVNGALSWQGKKIEPDILLNIRDFSFSLADSKISRVNGALKFNGFAPLSTPGVQTLTISEAEAGLPLKNGEINFRINSEKLFIDKIQWDVAGGALYTNPFQTDIANPKIKKLTLNLKGLQLEDLLILIDQKGLSGTGNLNGQIPVEFFEDYSFLIQDGVIEASPEGGVIRYRPSGASSFLSGDNENIKILVKALDNFQYKKLKITLKGGTKDGLEGILNLSGSNPDLYNGRIVELNVNLSGELLESLQSALGVYKIPGQIQEHLLK